jgi:hypothetical protein
MLGLQTKPLNRSQAFIADYTRRYCSRSVTSGSHTVLATVPFVDSLVPR